MSSVSINDILGPGGLQSVAIYDETDARLERWDAATGAYVGAGIPETSPGSGIYLANIIPRRDTLTNLLNNTVGGVGEISEATDWDALVLHNGVLGGAKLLYCKPKYVQIVAFIAQALTTGSAAPIEFAEAAAGMADTSIWADTSPTEFVVPAGANRCRVTANCGFAANTTGLRELTLTQNDGNTVVSIDKRIASQVSYTFLNASVVTAVDATLPLNVRAYQNSGGNLNTYANPFVRANLEFWVA